MTNFEEACKMSAEKWVASFPDEVEAHISCRPMHIPKTGWVNDFMTGAKPVDSKAFIAEEASPTPGRITWSARRIISGSAVSTYSAPNLFRAFSTERMLPAL